MGWLVEVGLLVAEHGPEDVDAVAGDGEDGLTVAFALGALAFVDAVEAGQRWMLISAEV